MRYSDPITFLKSIGSKKIEAFNSHGIYTVHDLFYYFPRRHLDRTSVKKIKDLIEGESCTIIASIKTFGVKPIHPEFDKLEKNDDPLSTGEVIPLYSLTAEFKSVGIDQRVFRKLIKEVLSYDINIPEFFSIKVLKDYNLVSLKEALRNIHYSSNSDKLNIAIKRLKFDEHFFLQLFMAIRKKSIKSLGTKSLSDVGPYFQ